MANTRPGTQLLILGALLLFSAGCRQPHQGWEPPLEATSTRFLQNQVEEALQFVRGAQDDVATDPGQAEEELNLNQPRLSLLKDQHGSREAGR